MDGVDGWSNTEASPLTRERAPPAKRSLSRAFDGFGVGLVGTKDLSFCNLHTGLLEYALTLFLLVNPSRGEEGGGGEEEEDISGVFRNNDVLPEIALEMRILQWNCKEESWRDVLRWGNTLASM